MKIKTTGFVLNVGKSYDQTSIPDWFGIYVGSTSHHTSWVAYAKAEDIMYGKANQVNIFEGLK